MLATIMSDRSRVPTHSYGNLPINLQHDWPKNSQSVDLRVLVLAADGAEPTLAVIEQALDYLGTPYQTKLMAGSHRSDEDRLVGMLADGDHAFYQGVILTTGYLSYRADDGWTSALSPIEWETLRNYEAAFGIRRVCWYTYPTTEYGFEGEITTVSTLERPLSTHLTAVGHSIFGEASPLSALTLQGAEVYLSRPVPSALPLLVDDAGHALCLLRASADGRECLSLTFDSNPNLLHGLVLSADLIRWVTRGVFIGERRLFLSVQVDDLLIDSAIWEPETPCGTDPHNTGSYYRLTESDLGAVARWQQFRRTRTAASDLTLDLAFNGAGASGLYQLDTLTPAVQKYQAAFRWINHTFHHENLDAVEYATARDEIDQNVAAANRLGLTRFDPSCLITPSVSGLANPACVRAAFDSGIRFLVSDAAIPEQAGLGANIGRPSTLEPAILLIPRRSTNLFYNVSTPAQWMAEYNCSYRAYWGRDLNYEEILERESSDMLVQLLRGDASPWMFHEANLRAYDGTHSLLSDLLDRVLDRYERMATAPIRCPSMRSLGDLMGMERESSVQATITAEYLVLRAERPAVVPVTGLGDAGVTKLTIDPTRPIVLSR